VRKAYWLSSRVMWKRVPIGTCVLVHVYLWVERVFRSEE
jgi:hypothetical protein